MFDLAVVGAGPAGALAARTAARRGLDVALLERSALPRYKRCGGGLLGITAENAGLDLAGLGLLHDEISAFRVTWGGRLGYTRREPAPFLRMVMRESFDAALVDAAAAAGAQVRTGVVVTGFDEDGDGVRLATRGGEPVRARYVVGADGVSSRLAAAVGVRCGQVDLGLEGEFPTPARSGGRGWAGRVWLDWGPVPGSYAWLFPKGDRVTVGVIGDRASSAGLRRYYAHVVGSLGLGSALVEGGHHTRVADVGSPLASAGGRLLLAGDAAGLLEPWTREGISFATRSGRLAGDAVADALGAGGVATDYAQRVSADLRPEIEAGRRLLAAYTRRPGVFHAALASPPGWREFRQVLVGRTCLADLLARSPVRAALGLLGA